MNTAQTAQPVSTTTQSKEPWSVASPYLSNMYSTAAGYQASGVGYNPYPNSTVATPSATQMDALNNLQAIYGNQAQRNDTAGAMALAKNMIDTRGLTPGLTNVENKLYSLGDKGNESYEQYKAIYGDQAASDIWKKMNTDADTATNPYLQKILDAQNRVIGDRVNASVSGAGRYGSGAHTDIMARSLGEAEAPILSADYEARQARKAQAATGLMGVDTIRGQASQGMLGALDTQGRLYGASGDIEAQGLARAGQWASMIPQLQEAEAAPQKSLLGLGEYRTGLDQQQLDASVKAWNAQQAYPWEQLSRESAIVGNAGALGGTTNTNVSNYRAPFAQRLVGGAIAGAGVGSAFGPWGAPVGAAGGSLLSLL
ncbi:MAG TPA: hypothetical protein VEO53_12365 [Candidatus Binatia bacterium]|nr:hypothetical protein [Candidatus Binatia bacterium]